MMERRKFMTTKNDMARVIVQALWNMPTLPNSDNEKVLKMAKRRKSDLITEHDKSVKILLESIK